MGFSAVNKPTVKWRFVDVTECANFNETNVAHKVRLFDKILDSNKLANSTGSLAEISVELSPD